MGIWDNLKIWYHSRRLKSSDLETRRDAIKKLGELENSRAVGPMIAALKEDDEYPLLQVAAKAFGKIGKTAVLPLIDALNDEDERGRQYAVWALGEIKDPRAVPVLIDALKDRDVVRNEAVAALGKIRYDKAIELLVEALKDENKSVRQGAVVAVVKLAKYVDINLSEVAESLQEYGKQIRKRGDPEENEEARIWIVETYRQIADAVAGRKQIQMGGMLPAKIKPPKPGRKGLYHQMRKAVA